jgi:hypothetical protein
VVPIGLCADTLGYLPRLFVGMMFREATRVILIWVRRRVHGGDAGHVRGWARGQRRLFLVAVVLDPADATVAAATAAQHAVYNLGNLVGSGLAQVLVSSRER